MVHNGQDVGGKGRGNVSPRGERVKRGEFFMERAVFLENGTIRRGISTNATEGSLKRVGRQTRKFVKGPNHYSLPFN